MSTLKDICKKLSKRNITYFESEDGRHLQIPACEFSNKNFFDYDEPYKPPRCKNDKFLLQLFNDPHIIVMTCDMCGGCAGW